MEKIRVLIGDRDILYRQGLIDLLEKTTSVEILGASGNGKVILDATMRLEPDILFLAFHLTDITGLHIMRSISLTNLHTKVIALTIIKWQYYIFEMFRLGIRGYLLKTAKPLEVLNALTAVINDQFVVDFTLQNLLPSTSSKEEMQRQIQHYFKSIHANLTEREYDVLVGIGSGMNNKELAKWLFLSDKTIKNHLTSIYKKFGVKDRTQALIYALQNHILKDNCPM